MSNNNISPLMSVAQDVLKRHNCSFDIVDASTIILDGWPLNMCPVLEQVEDGISFTCPIAYYITDEQCALILDSCQKYRTRIGYTEFGWGPYLREPNDSDDGISVVLPDSVVFVDKREDLLINAHYSLDTESIMAAPDEFYDNLLLIKGYALALRNQTVRAIINDRLVKTKADPADPRSLFYCSLLLYNQNEEARNWLMVDFNDVKTMLESGREVVFYPLLTAESFDGLVHKMEKALRADLSPADQFDVIVSISLPDNCRPKPESIYGLSFRDSPSHIKTIVYLEDGSHSFTAGMVLVKKGGD